MSAKDKGYFLSTESSLLRYISVLLLICLNFIFMDYSLSLGID